MARGKRQTKTLKKSEPYFIVEGCTEENYIKILKILFRKSAEIKNTNGGNAKGVMKKALTTISSNKEYNNFIVWFDNDRFNISQDTNTLNKLSVQADVVRSYPCVESWLLSHFVSLQSNQLNINCSNFEAKLSQHIANYNKSECQLLKQNISAIDIDNAKKNYPQYNGNIENIIRWFE